MRDAVNRIREVCKSHQYNINLLEIDQLTTIFVALEALGFDRSNPSQEKSPENAVSVTAETTGYHSTDSEHYQLSPSQIPHYTYTSGTMSSTFEPPSTAIPNTMAILCPQFEYQPPLSSSTIDFRAISK